MRSEEKDNFSGHTIPVHSVLLLLIMYDITDQDIKKAVPPKKRNG